MRPDGSADMRRNPALRLPQIRAMVEHTQPSPFVKRKPSRARACITPPPTHARDDASVVLSPLPDVYPGHRSVALYLKSFFSARAGSIDEHDKVKRLHGFARLSVMALGQLCGGRSPRLHAAELSGPAQCCSPRTVFQNCSVEFMCGNGVSGTGTSRKRHSGAQPSATLNTNSRSAGIAAHTSSVRRR